MEGAKISTCFEGLIKFHKTTSQFKSKSEEVSHIRVLVAKLHHALKCPEKLNRNALLGQANYAQSLVLTLQHVYDREVHQAVAQCMAELLGQTKTGQRARIFVKLGATQAVCQAIALEWRETSPNESALLSLHLILAKLAPKDKRLATKARLCQCTPAILSLLRQGLASRGAGALLGLLRAYAASRQSSASLGRHGAVQLLLRLLIERAASRRQPGPLRRAVEALSQLTKVRINVTRAVAQGAPDVLMELLSAAVSGDTAGTAAAPVSAGGQHHAALLRSLLLTLRHITAAKTGRAAFIETGGPIALYALCTNQRSASDHLLSADACIVLRQCAPRAYLPVPGQLSPHTPALLSLLLSTAAAAAEVTDSQASADADINIATTASDDVEPDATDEHDGGDSDCDSSDEARERRRQQQRRLSDESATALVNFSGGRDPRSSEELRAAYSHLEPELQPRSRQPSQPPPPPQLTQSPSLPSFLTSQLHQVPSRAQPVSAAGRLSVSATSSLLAPSAPSLQRRRSLSGWPEVAAHPSDPRVSDRVRSIVHFAILASHEQLSACPPPHREACDTRRSDCAMELMLEDARRWIAPDDVLGRVVYDLDNLVADSQQPQQPSTEAADDERLLAQLSCAGKRPDHLLFESRFESGNLRRAIQVRAREYDLALCPDAGHRGQTQWFYFRLANCEAGVPYRFNVINCEKPKSQFNCGMRPLVYSVREAQLGRPHWLRSGRRLCYYRNQYLRRKRLPAAPVPANAPSASPSPTGGGKPYYTASFTLTFRHTGDVCYVAYYVPYTYSRLLADLDGWRAAASRDPSVFYAQQWLCDSLGGNPLPMLTVTAAATAADAAAAEPDRPCVLVTGRVHPGEANASWVVRGFVDHLLSPAARSLRRQLVLKIVPMLNPDGVINGNHRCSLSVEDLNRAWISPTPTRQPEIYHAKGLLSHLCASGRRPVVYIDCHGHSRHNNVFLFGCCPRLSWLPDDRNNPGWQEDGSCEDPGYRELPRLLTQIAPAFSWNDCNFKIDRAKETTARVVAWRHLRILRAYTLEASYSCCDQGPYKGLHVGTRELEEMGAKLGEALQCWAEGGAPAEDPLPTSPPPPTVPLPASALTARCASAGDGGDDDDDEFEDDEGDDEDNDAEDNCFVVGEVHASDPPCRSSFVTEPDGESLRGDFP